MHNWSVDTTRLKQNPLAYKKWKTEQLINYGLGEEKLDEAFVREHFDELNIDPRKKAYIQFLLWPPQS
jgi:hypothetical protein